MKEISLSRGLVAIVDEQDYPYLNQFKWHATHMSNSRRDVFYAAGAISAGSGLRKNVLMHRIIMNPPGKLIVDHIDKNGLNNRRENLRICTVSQNQANRRSVCGSSSKYLGVSFSVREMRKLKWLAQIKRAGKVVYLGRFRTEIEAALEYDKHARIIHGEFANLNFPD